MPVAPAVPHRWNALQLAGFFSHQAGCEAGPGKLQNLQSRDPVSSAEVLSSFPGGTVFLRFLYLVEAQITELPQPDVEAHMPRFP